MMTAAPVMAAPEGSVTCPRSAATVAAVAGTACGAGAGAVCDHEPANERFHKDKSSMNLKKPTYFSTFISYVFLNSHCLRNRMMAKASIARLQRVRRRDSRA